MRRSRRGMWESEGESTPRATASTRGIRARVLRWCVSRAQKSRVCMTVVCRSTSGMCALLKQGMDETFFSEKSRCISYLIQPSFSMLDTATSRSIPRGLSSRRLQVVSIHTRSRWSLLTSRSTSLLPTARKTLRSPPKTQHNFP